MKDNMEIVTSSSSIIPEVLKKDNYERWSILMQHYLELQNLWEAVQSYRMPRGGNKEEWIKKNTLALYAIKISCGTEAFDQIKKIRSAKGAWDALAVMLKPPAVEVVTHDIFEHHQERLTGKQETLHKFICGGDISRVKRFLRDNPDARSPKMLEFALQVAISHEHKNMAHYLYKDIPKDFLQGDRGFFLLGECITKKMFDIALDLLSNFPELAFRCPSGSIPIILTIAQTPPPFLRLNELGFWGRWMYNCTRVKVYSIKPRSNPGGGVGVVQDQLRKWILALYKFHLVGVLIGLLCFFPALFTAEGLLMEVGPLFVAAVLKLDLAGILIALPLMGFVPTARQTVATFGMLSGALILFLVILRSLGQGCGPIGVPLLVLGLLQWLIKIQKDYRIILLERFSLFSLILMPLLMFVNKVYNLKLMDAYANEIIRVICGSLSNLDENQFVQSGAVEATFQAIENDIPEIVIELITKAKNSNTLWSNSDLENSRNMFACAIAHRQEKLAHFLHGFGTREDDKDTNMVTTIDEDGNSTLHLAAKLAPQYQLDHISGAALQLQNELHWFKSVECIVPQFYNKQKNKDGETPTQVFLREHMDLLKEAEGWMKKVAESCTVVGALVITITFAAAFTVPGGNNQNTGFPIFLNKTIDSSKTTVIAIPTMEFTVSNATVVPFLVFAVSDAISLFAASSSVLMFMGILTSRYACQDFHISLPIKLIIGLSSLFISIAAMIVAFWATLFMMLHGEKWIVIPITFLASIPVTLFVSLQSPLLVEIYASTFRPYIFYRRKYLKCGMRVCSSLNRRWWFRTTKGRMVVMLCALVLIYISFTSFVG